MRTKKIYDAKLTALLARIRQEDLDACTELYTLFTDMILDTTFKNILIREFPKEDERTAQIAITLWSTASRFDPTRTISFKEAFEKRMTGRMLRQGKEEYVIVHASNYPSVNLLKQVFIQIQKTFEEELK
jgi:hypothetical protein